MRISSFRSIVSFCLSLVVCLSFAESCFSQVRDPEHVYELRTYTAARGKLDDLHSRFKDHTMKLFEKHGMENIIFWTPSDRKIR